MDLESLPLSSELLGYYRSRIVEFEKEREELIERVTDCEVKQAELHRLEWEVKRRQDEISELQKSLSDSQTHLMEERHVVVELFAELDSLKIQEMEDRKKIRDLLAISQPIQEEVVFSRDQQPERTVVKDRPKRQMSNRLNGKLDLGSSSSPERDSSGVSQSRKSRTGLVVSSSAEGKSLLQSQRVMRTVYLPNEKSDILQMTIEALREQLEDKTRAYKEERAVLLEDRRVRQEEDELRAKRDEERIALLEGKIKRLEDTATRSTRDYLVLKHTSQMTQRSIMEETERIRAENQRLIVDMKALQDRLQLEKQVVVSYAQDTSERRVEEFRLQASQKERMTLERKEEAENLASQLQSRVAQLEKQNRTLKDRLGKLDRRRSLEMSGYSADIAAFRKDLKTMEASQRELLESTGKAKGKNDIDAMKRHLASLELSLSTKEAYRASFRDRSSVLFDIVS